MYKVFQVSQGTQDKIEKAVILLSPEKTQRQAPQGASPAGREEGP